MRITRAVLGAFTAAAVLCAPTASAVSGERPVIVELFTSQGCSSCPPADSLMADLARNRSDMIVLSLPVDIWDYNGWKDTLARPEFSARQKHYSQSRGDHQVYTPQVVVDGQAHGIGSDRSQILTLVEETSPARVKEVAPLSVSERNGMLVVDLGEANAQMERGASVMLLRVVKSRTVPIGRGENRGREITYTNVVRSMVRLGFWTGAPARFEMPLPEARADEADGYVVIVQKTWGDTLGPILAAGKGGAL